MPEIVDVVQGTEEWFRARMGMPTASEFHTVLAKGEGKTRSKYMRRLAGEIITGKPAESYTNTHLERGKEMEEEARAAYAMGCDDELAQVGFVKNLLAGCSPDSLVGDRGILEIKTALPDILIEKLLMPADWFPPEHKAQCQGALWVCERDWVDLMIYWPGMPRFIRRAYRDDYYLSQLYSEVKNFGEELQVLVNKLRRMK
jgi:hypothetical protein